MNRIFSNSGSRDFVINPFNELAGRSTSLYLAAPYFTYAKPVLKAINEGKSVQLLVGLNATTDANALKAIHGRAEVAIRYLTHRFHAKIYVSDDAALVGSSNLTEPGFFSNREAVICLDQPEDAEIIDEVRGGWDNLSTEFWNLNRSDFSRVKNTLTHLIYGPGDFIQRLHDVLFDPSMKLSKFGRFCALELYGTVKPTECPPMNGRMAKALRYLGFDVSPT